MKFKTLKYILYISLISLAAFLIVSAINYSINIKKDQSATTLSQLTSTLEQRLQNREYEYLHDIKEEFDVLSTVITLTEEQKNIINNNKLLLAVANNVREYMQSFENIKLLLDNSNGKTINKTKYKNQLETLETSELHQNIKAQLKEVNTNGHYNELSLDFYSTNRKIRTLIVELSKIS